MITEVARQLPQNTKPDAVFCSVGGGGLAGGVITGCQSVGWDDGKYLSSLKDMYHAAEPFEVPLVTVETSGSNCFYQSLALNKGPFLSIPTSPPDNVEAVYNAKNDVTVARLSKITSQATSLGASVPAPAVVKMALDRKGGVKSIHTDDVLAMQSCLRFAGIS